MSASPCGDETRTYDVCVDKHAVSSIRFPSPLRDRIRAQAETEHRTFSGTVLHLVQVALADQHDHAHDQADADEVERLHAVYHETIGRD